MNRKICIIYQNYLDDKNNVQIGGVENYLLHLAEELTNNQFSVAVIQQGSNNRIIETSSAMVHKVRCNKKNPYYELLKYTEDKFNTVDDCVLFGAHTAIQETKFVRSLAIQHGIHWDGVKVPKVFSAQNILGPIARFAEARATISQISKTKRLVCVDNNFVNWLRTQGCARLPELTVIPNFVDTRIEPRDVRCNGTIKIVFARRFVEKRGTSLLADTLPPILSNHPNVELTIAGEGPMESYLRAAFAGYSQVLFTKYHPQESVSFHSQFDIALVPTLFSECTSFSLLEAMYAGCCVLCTNVGGMTNIVIDGFNGRMVPPEKRYFASALEELIQNEDLRNRLRGNAIATASQGFSLKSWSARWLQVVREVFENDCR